MVKKTEVDSFILGSVIVMPCVLRGKDADTDVDDVDDDDDDHDDADSKIPATLLGMTKLSSRAMQVRVATS